jgi:cold shock CspA family protein
MQGVIKAFDPSNGDGIVVSDTDLSEYNLASNALEGSIFRMLRQGQRVVFVLDASGRATSLSLGSESDMGTPIV